MKKWSNKILLLVLVIVSIMFFLPHKEKRTFDDVKTVYNDRFDKIQFGTYEQDGDDSDENEPIEWLMLDEKDDKILVISKDTIVCISYNNESKNITWEKSILRLYLNNIFYNYYLNDEERRMVLPTTLINNTKNEFGHSNGANTVDKIFVLSIDEYKKYFKSNEERIAAGTPYTESLGLYVSSTLPIADLPIKNGTYYWARNVGYHKSDAACINWDGKINTYGYDCKSDGMGVRPCMWLKKEALKWQKK